MIATLTLAPLLTLLQQFAASAGLTELAKPYTWRVFRFSLWQASLSTGLSLLLAMPMAVALARKPHFPGRRLLIRLLGLPLIIPTLVAVTGIVIVYGRNGWLSETLQAGGIDFHYRFYGLTGILLAHLFLNFPLATRVFLQSLEAVPVENWRIAGQLGMNGWQQWWWLEFPVIRRVIPALLVLIFSLCFTSFAVVLTLGGGPAASTLEVAIYQAMRLDFDIPAAVVLALLQLVFCALLVVAGSLFHSPALLQGQTRSQQERWFSSRQHWVWWLIAAGAVLILLPMFAIILRGLNTQTLETLSQVAVWQAFSLSAGVGCGAGLLALLLATGLLLGSRHLQLRRQQSLLARLLYSTGLLALVLPAVVLSTGLFLLLQQHINVLEQALWPLLLVNSLTALPFTLAILQEPMYTVAERHDRLCAALGIRGVNRLRLIEWPLLRPALGTAMGLGSALAAGDLTAIAMFGSPDFQTLPLMLYRLLGAYKVQQASVCALLLLLLGLLLYATFDYWGKRR